MSKYPLNKFLIVVSSDDILENEDLPVDILNRIFLTEDPLLCVIKCKREEWTDNLVTVKIQGEWTDEFIFVEDVDGMLYLFDDYWTMREVINRFE